MKLVGTQFETENHTCEKGLHGRWKTCCQADEKEDPGRMKNEEVILGEECFLWGRRMLSVYKLFGHTLPWSGDKMHAHALPIAFPQKHVADCVLLENLLCGHGESQRMYERGNVCIYCAISVL